MKFEEQFEKFYTSTKSIYKELVNISGDSDVWKSLFDRVSLEEISKELSKQSRSLFRYGDVEKSIDTLQWKYILEQSWKTGGHFPTLYKVNQIYDKREVVICFLMVMQFSLKEADEFLRAVSFNEQNYDNRELYPLHYKEGFFRFVILWNEQHDHVLSFDMAVDYYKKYEEIVSVYVLKMAEKVLGSKESLEDGKDLKKYKNMKYYCDLLESIWKEMCQWKHPYTLRQQDILQRMLVLVSHAERAQREYNESGSEDMLEYNDKTRGLQDRGTRLCISIAEECAGISKFSDAMKCFADRELPEMGEAYWRAISYIMQAYAESGKSPYYESALIEKRIFSNKNAEAKRFRKVNLFGKNSEFIQKRILSFAAMADEVREYIRSESANTVLIAELINPVGRNDSSIFSGKQEVNTYSALSGFIGSYVTWLEGKSRQNSLGQIREPMPYYFFKREMVLKYALACGSTSIEEIGEYLEFAGNSELNIKSPKEILIMRAIEYCEKYSSNKQIIGIIRNMQSLLLYFEAERAIEGSIKAVEFEKFIKKRVDKITNIFLYEPAINALNGKKRELTKQELISGYYSQLFLWNMLMEIIRRTDSDMKMEDYAPMVIDVSLFMDNNYYADEGFINWTTWPERMTEEYIKELQEIYFIDDGEINKKRVFSNLVERVLAELVKKILPLEYLRDECSFELKMFYEKQFYTLSGIRQYYFDVLTKQGLENYSKLLDWTVKASILFAFHSGCKNFSLTWYEKKFRINHFQNKYKDESGKGIDGYTWHRWTGSMDNFEKQENMWEMIALDAKRIRKCYRYLEKNNAELIIKDIYERYNIQRDKVHKECIELLVWMKKHNMGIMDEVVSKLRYCEKELDGN